MLNLSDTHRRQFAYLAGVLYTLSLHKYFTRDALDPGTGIQGFLEAGLICAAFVCSLAAARSVFRKGPRSLVLLCFAAFGIVSIASAFRSFNPTLSAGESILFFVVLGIGHLTSQEDLVTRLFQSIYWTYTATLAVGLVLGLALPGQFNLWSVDQFSGRTRLSVFNTFPGTMGETAAYLVLLAPILFERSHWASRLFLVLINCLAGGKVSTILLLALLALEYLYTIHVKRFLLLVAFCAAMLSLAFYVAGLRGARVGQMIGSELNTMYGNDVADEAASLDGRLDLWQGSLTLLTDNPALGYGFSGVREALINIADWSGSSHNGYLEIGLTGGIVGGAAFLFGFGGVLRACVNSSRRLRHYILAIFCYMAVIALAGITFTFPSDFGLLILVLLLYRSAQSKMEREFFQPEPIQDLYPMAQ